MVNGYIDPYLVACPPADAGAGAFQAFVDALLEWRDMAAKPGFELYVSNKSYDVLLETGHYPMWEPIRCALATLGVEHVQTKDVIDIAHGLLTKSKPIEDILGLQDFLLDNVKTAFPWPDGSRAAPLENSVIHLATAMCIHGIDRTDGWIQLLVSRGCVDDGSLHVEITVCDADGERREAFGWPLRLERDFPVVQKSATATGLIDPVSWWLEGIRNRDPVLLRSGLEESARRRMSPAGPPRWSLQRGFPDTIFNLDGLRQSGVGRAVLRACLETIFEENMAATHHLRCGAGPNDVQITRQRDGALAWRRDIDREYHLHYWMSESGPELASVVLHREVSIPE